MDENTMTTFDKPKFFRAEIAAAWVCFGLGFLFARYVTRFAGGLLGGIFWAGFGVLGAVYVRVKGLWTSHGQKLVFAMSELFCLAPLFCANGFINVLAAWFSFLLDFYLLLSLSGGGLFGENFPADLLKSVFVQPFRSILEVPAAAFSPVRGGSRLKTVGYVLIGLVIAVPLTIVAVVLLVLSDRRFADLMGDFFHALPGLSLDLIWQLLLGAAVGMFLCGALFSAEKPFPETERPVNCRVLPPVIACTAVTPMCLFYLVYVITQFAGLKNALSDPAEYARRGFFELCAIAVVDITVIAVMQVFTARPQDKKPLSLKLYTTLISVFTLLFIASALGRMAVYVGMYGLTPMRVYPSWFMGLLAVVFVVVIVRQYVEFPLWRVLFAAFALMFGLLCFGNVDGHIARYNVSFAQSGGELDISSLHHLNGMACEPLAELLESGSALPEGISEDSIRRFLADELEDMQQAGFEYYSIPRARAMAAAEGAIQ